MRTGIPSSSPLFPRASPGSSQWICFPVTNVSKLTWLPGKTLPVPLINPHPPHLPPFPSQLEFFFAFISIATVALEVGLVISIFDHIYQSSPLFIVRWLLCPAANLPWPLFRSPVLPYLGSCLLNQARVSQIDPKIRSFRHRDHPISHTEHSHNCKTTKSLSD